MDAREFERLYEGFYLFGELPLEDEEEEGGGELEASLGSRQAAAHGARDRLHLSIERTEAIPVRPHKAERSTARVLRPERRPERPKPTEPALWRVQRSDRTGWRRRISVGRAPDNDIVIPHMSVSKVHAHFHGGTLVRLSPLHTAELLLSDAGSANGTVVGGRRLLTGEAEPIFSGNKILFGEVSCEVLSAAALFTRLCPR